MIRLSILSALLSFGVLLGCSSNQPAYLSAEDEAPLALPDSADVSRLGQIYPLPQSIEQAPNRFEKPFPPTSAVQESVAASGYSLGDQQWVLVAQSPIETWSQLLNFWREKNIPIVKQDLTIGSMQTDWFNESLQPGFEVRYLLQLERGLQPDNTEVYLYNQKRSSQSVVPLSFGRVREDKQHSQWLTQSLVDQLNKASNDVGNSLLATRLDLPVKVSIREETGEPRLVMTLDSQRSLLSITEALKKDPWVTYENSPSDLFYIDQLSPPDAKRPTFWSRINPFISRPPLVTSESKSQITLERILSEGIDWRDPQATRLFERFAKSAVEKRPKKDINGYLLVFVEGDEGEHEVFIRDGNGSRLPVTDSRNLLALLWRQLI